MSSEQVLWLIGTLTGAVGLGLWLGSELWRRDAERWQWWRARHFALCSMACSKAAGLDLSRTYVQTPQQMDAVTDEAMRKTPNRQFCGWRCSERMTMTEKLTEFDYLLNSMDAAMMADDPAEAGYYMRRSALLAYVRALEKNTTRYCWLRRFTGAGRTTRGMQQFVMSPPMPGERDLFRGSVAQHLDSAIDAALASETHNVPLKGGHAQGGGE